MTENPRIVINGKGDEREVIYNAHPDKKQRVVDYQAANKVIDDARNVLKKAEVGQDEAIWDIKTEYPMLPVAISCMTDTHWGSTRVNNSLLNQHLDLIESTPNFGMVTNGDHIDNFAPFFHSSGMMENPLPPTAQARAFTQRLKSLDDKDKIGVLSYGNHDTSMDAAGLDWYDAFMEDFKCPIFTAGGLLHIKYGTQNYDMALGHTYWGRSKINPSNAVKRFIEYEYPQADIGFLGHTHQSVLEHFDRGGKDVIALVGGTYKDSDKWSKRMGIGGREGKPGMTVMLWPDERKMQIFKDIEVAATFMRALIYQAENQ